jgi:hypothetical protein
MYEIITRDVKTVTPLGNVTNSGMRAESSERIAMSHEAKAKSRRNNGERSKLELIPLP